MRKSKVPNVPLSEHHMRAKKIYMEAVKKGELTAEEADELYFAWIKRRRSKLGAREQYSRVVDRLADFVLKQISLPAEEFRESWPQWWGEGVPVLGKLKPVQVRLLRILIPTTHPMRVMSILDTAVTHELVTNPEAMTVYRIWTRLRKGVK